MPTRNYHNLSRRITELEARLLPQISPTGVYSPQDYDQVRGYMLLCHAEIESYLEDMAIEIAERSLSNWNKKNRVNRCLAALMLHHSQDQTPKPQSMSSHIHTAISKHIKTVRESNHGVKESNLFKMFVPLGLEKGEVSSILTAELDSLGAARGKIAHTSARLVKSPPDPGTVRDQINKTLEELADFDALAILLRTR